MFGNDKIHNKFNNAKTLNEYFHHQNSRILASKKGDKSGVSSEKRKEGEPTPK